MEKTFPALRKHWKQNVSLPEKKFQTVFPYQEKHETEWFSTKGPNRMFPYKGKHAEQNVSLQWKHAEQCFPTMESHQTENTLQWKFTKLCLHGKHTKWQISSHWYALQTECFPTRGNTQNRVFTCSGKHTKRSVSLHGESNNSECFPMQGTMPNEVYPCIEKHTVQNISLHMENTKKKFPSTGDIPALGNQPNKVC